MASTEFFKSNILPLAIASGGFGNNPEFVGIVENLTQGKDQFASSICFVEIDLRVDGVLKKFPTVCKFQCDSVEKREMFQSDFQFFNELLVYKEILPMYPKSVLDVLPLFYFGTATLGESPKDDVIIIEDLTPRGYRQSSERIFLDFEHCSLAFKKLGEFHGASLQLKTKSQLKFANKINRLVETRWIDKAKDDQNFYFSENAKRGIIPLMKNGEHLQKLNYFLDKLGNVHGLMKEIFEVNDISLLCHGDFCRNNMVFKYEDGLPVDVKFYDLATARYSSPVIDISFFLFLNTTSELRRKHFGADFLNIYLDALKSVAGPAAPTMEELWKEFEHKALYGYILAAFFLPIMMDDRPDNLAETLHTLTLEERVKINLIRGGQKVTDILVDSVRDLISWGCLN